jgi:hypothetical protein
VSNPARPHGSDRHSPAALRLRQPGQTARALAARVRWRARLWRHIRLLADRLRLDEIRPCTSGDLQLLERRLPTDSARQLEQALALPQTGRGDLLVAWLWGEPVGHLLVTWTEPDDPPLPRSVPTRRANRADRRRGARALPRHRHRIGHGGGDPSPGPSGGRGRRPDGQPARPSPLPPDGLRRRWADIYAAVERPRRRRPDHRRRRGRRLPTQVAAPTDNLYGRRLKTPVLADDGERVGYAAYACVRDLRGRDTSAVAYRVAEQHALSLRAVEQRLGIAIEGGSQARESPRLSCWPRNLGGAGWADRRSP